MRRFRANLVLVYAVYAASIVSGLVITPVLVDALGKEAYGIWAFLGAAVVFLGLLDFGLSPALVRFSAEYRGRSSPEATSALASAVLALYAGLSLLVLAVGVALTLALPWLVGVPDDLVSAARIAAILLVASLAARFVLGVGTNLLVGHQRWDVVNVGNLVSIAVYTALVVALVTKRGDLALLAALAVATTVLRLALPLLWLPRELPGLRLSPRLVTRERVRGVASFSWQAFLIHVAAKVIFSADVLIVGIVLGPEAAALYGVPAKLFALLFSAGTAGTDLLFPALSELEGREDEGSQRRLLARGLRLGAGVMLLLALPLLFIPDQLIEAWIGGGFEDSYVVAALLGAALLVHQPAHVLSQYLLARLRQRELALASIAVVTANVVLSVVLAVTVGLWGVAAATVATQLVFVLVVVPRLVRAAGGPRASVLGRAVLRPTLAALAAALPVLGVLSRALDPDTLVGLVPVGVAWVVACGAALWFVGLSPDERSAVRGRLLPRPTAAAPEVIGP